MAFVNSGGVNIGFEDTGEGYPILFLHEFAGDIRSWESQVRFFCRRYRCITVAARGYPPSDVPDDIGKYGWHYSIDDAIAVLDYLQIAQCHVIGLSMGAYTGILMALRHSDRLSALVAASGGSGAHPPGRQNFIEETTVAAERTLREGGVAAEDMGNGPSRIQLKCKDPRGWLEFCAHLAEHPGTGSGYTLQQVQARRPSLHEFSDELKNCRMPTLLMVGDEDDACLDVNLWLKRTLPVAGLSVVPQSGHLLNLEDPAGFNARCVEFFGSVEKDRWFPRQRGEGSGRVYS